MGRSFVAVGLGFGDEGKGSCTDYLTRTQEAKTVIRFNGGAQAGHNVVLQDGRHHCFAQFGSGTFARARTYLSEFMLVNPFSLISEARHLESMGVPNPLSLLTIDRNAVVTTPLHIAANRLKEIARSKGKHGSCGMGIGETRRLAVWEHFVSLTVGELQSATSTRMKLRRIQEILLSDTTEIRKELKTTSQVMQERAILEDDDLEYILDCYGSMSERVDIQGDRGQLHRILESQTTIFEGAQGVLLDESYGFHPYTTWTDTTFKNALTLLDGAGADVHRVGITRVFPTRHGAGPFVTESPELSFSDHNKFGPWQNGFRFGYFDLVSFRYAIKVLGGVDSIVLSHTDQAKTQPIKVCTRYDGPFEGSMLTLPTSIEEQEKLTVGLMRSKPVYQQASNMEEFIGDVQFFGGSPIRIVSEGPTAEDKRQIRPW